MKRAAKWVKWPYVCALFSGAGLGCWVASGPVALKPEVIAAASAAGAVLWLLAFDWTDRMLK